MTKAPWDGYGWDVRLLLLAAAGLLVGWSFAVPVFEGPDEFVHWQYARHLHDTWRLPVYRDTFAEGNNPPLYYAAIAPVARRTATPPPIVWLDGLDRFQIPFLPHLYLRAADDDGRYWPIRSARLVTALLSLIAIAACARIGFEATGRASTALLTAGFVGFLPQLTFRGSHVSNDALVVTCAALTLWPIVAIVRRGFTWRRGVLASVALALAWLTKINTIALVAPLAIALLIAPAEGSERGERGNSGQARWGARLRRLSVFGITLAIVAPWSIRNVWLYGDPFAIGAMRTAVGSLMVERSLWDEYFIDPFWRDLFTTFVGSFGHMNVWLPRPAYVAYGLFMVMCAIGLLRRARRDPAIARVAAVLAVLVAAALAIVVRINLQFAQPQGRYLFPALPAIALAMALGLEAWPPWRRASAWPARATVAAWAIANLLILTRLVIPAFMPLLPTISEALTIVRLQPVRDLSADTGASDRAGSYRVTGDAPELAATVRVAAADALFVIFDLAGSVPRNADGGAPADTPAELDGVVTLTLAPDDREVRVPFQWRADGRRRTIYLTVLDRPEWQGTVAGVRVQPVLHAPEALRGRTLVVEHVRLAGSIPSHDF